MKALHLAAAVMLMSAALPELAADAGPANQLQQIPVFALGGIGVAGTTSNGERALRALLEEKTATKQLEVLLRSATPAGQLYALLGLRTHDRAAYERALAAFPKVNVTVETIGGCIVTHLPFQDLRKRIEAGDYDNFRDRDPR